MKRPARRPRTRPALQVLARRLVGNISDLDKVLFGLDLIMRESYVIEPVSTPRRQSWEIVF